MVCLNVSCPYRAKVYEHQPYDQEIGRRWLVLEDRGSNEVVVNDLGNLSTIDIT